MDFLFKDRDGQTPLPTELRKGLRIKNIQNMGELDEHEEENIADGLVWLEKSKEDYLLLTFWVKLHKKLFENVWNWAGKIRGHELNNPYFFHPHQIRIGLKQLEDDLRYWLKENSFSKEEISARFHERIETIHPFANGNGRFGRILIEHFCKKLSIAIPGWGVKFKEDPKLRRSTYIQSLDHARQKKGHKELIEFMFS